MLCPSLQSIRVSCGEYVTVLGVRDDNNVVVVLLLPLLLILLYSFCFYFCLPLCRSKHKISTAAATKRTKFKRPKVHGKRRRKPQVLYRLDNFMGLPSCSFSIIYCYWNRNDAMHHSFLTVQYCRRRFLPGWSVVGEFCTKNSNSTIPTVRQMTERTGMKNAKMEKLDELLTQKS